MCARDPVRATHSTRGGVDADACVAVGLGGCRYPKAQREAVLEEATAGGEMKEVRCCECAEPMVCSGLSVLRAVLIPCCCCVLVPRAEREQGWRAHQAR
eukprot:93867-Rhodomonas_salina.1